MARDRTLAISFLMSSDPRRYRQVIRDLEKGENNYPKDIPSAFRLLNEYRTLGGNRDSQVPTSTHLTFAQQKGNKRKIECHGCGLPDYTIYNCPKCSKDKNKINSILKQKKAERSKDTDPKKYFNRPKNQKPSFVQVKMPKNPIIKGNPKEDPDLGFVQIDSLDDDLSID